MRESPGVDEGGRGRRSEGKKRKKMRKEEKQKERKLERIGENNMKENEEES